MPRKPYIPPELIPAKAEDWLAVLQAVRNGTARLQTPVADLVAQPLADSTDGMKQELGLLEATLEGGRRHGTLDEADLELLEDRCARIRRALHMKPL